ncbi:hypothetical protein MHU86_24536 [Fragilaria crotonensis]|nr:hypothetical protein MHU86_24536 [Fragilaria crotonensis]
MNDVDVVVGPDPEVMEAINKGNAVVFLDISLGKVILRRLWDESSWNSLLKIAPKRARTFVSSVQVNFW